MSSEVSEDAELPEGLTMLRGASRKKGWDCESLDGKGRTESGAN